MRKNFKNFLTSTVFILLSGFLLFHANTTSGDAVDALRSLHKNAAFTASTKAHYTPISADSDTNFGRIPIEETEVEEFDPASDNSDVNPDFFHHGISALFHFLGWEHTLKSHEGIIAYHTPSLKYYKRYIRFEIFRI